MLFSTDTGDAWILEPANHLAYRLAIGGDPLSIDLAETDTRYTLGWQGRYRIDGETFVYEDHQSGRLLAIRGYPLKHILRTITATDHS